MTETTTSRTPRPSTHDEAAVARLEPHRRALTAHCYRMLGSAFEADDAVQETMVRAWRNIDRYEGRGPFEAWLYRIATNVCLNLVRGRSRRAMPMDLGPAASPATVEPVTRPRGSWVGPVPDAWVLTSSATADPADAAIERAALRLAFVTALQRLPARQRAVLLLRDVLRWNTQEVAALFAATEASVKSALQRARATMRDAGVPSAATGDLEPDAAGLLEQYVDAFERYDVDALIALLHGDATMSMPPFDLWLQGADDIRTWWLREHAICQNSRLVQVAANGSPAVAQYRVTADGQRVPFAIHVLETSDGRINALHAFLEPDLFPLFGLMDDA